MRKAFITGITGQGGSYLAGLLLAKGYEVYGVIRQASTFNTGHLDHIYQDSHDPDARLFLYYGDLAKMEQLSNLIYNVKPEEIYHLGAQSHVRMSFDVPEYTGNVTGLGTTHILEVISHSGIKTRFYQASSSEMFGAVPPPQNENTSFRPRSLYACSKVCVYWMTVNYREGCKIFASNGILFNHESPMCDETIVTRKITQAIAHILVGKQNKLYLGNLKAKRDWGYAPEYVEVIWLMLHQQDEPEDYVIGIGEAHSIQEFLEAASVGLPFISTNVESVKEIRGGIIVSSPKEMAASIDKLLDNPEYRINLGFEGEKRVLEKYTWEIILQKYNDTFNRVIEGRL